MSFILDALKKSDAERQKRSTPGFADIPVSRDHRPPQRWLWVVGGLLAVNLVAVFALLLKPGASPPETPPSTVPATSPAEATTAGSAGRTGRPFADLVAEARQKTERADTATQRREPPTESPAAGGSEAAAAPQSPPAAASGSPAAATRNAGEAANTFESLRADGTLTLPDLHLDVHVYSEQPGERFVFINTKKYRENETLAEGPTVSQIAPEGVILEYRGTVFLLPRE